MSDQQSDLNREILEQLRSLQARMDTMSENMVRRDERYDVFATNFKERTQHISELMGVLNQGKTAAKMVAALIALLAGLGATWDWVISHIRIM